MASPILLQDKFEGMWRDGSRDQVPKNKVWLMQNWIPGLGAAGTGSATGLAAPLRKRGAWSYEGDELTTLDAAATVPKRVFWAAFDIAQQGDANTQLLAWDNNGKFFDLTSEVDRGDTTVPLHTPIFFRELVIWTSGGAAPKKYDGGGAATDLGGSPPSNARICGVWKERIIMSGNAAGTAESSIYFSAAGNAESWDTTNAVVGTDDAIQGFAALPNALLVFHPGSVEKILGDTPPSATNIGNLVRQPLFDNVGIYEPTALAVSNESAYWADRNGVYRSDGASLVNLTVKGGIEEYYRSQVGLSNSIAVGVWRRYVFVALHNSDTPSTLFVCDADQKNWFEFRNIAAENFAVRYGSSDELYFANRQTKFVGGVSSCFDFSGDDGSDPDGDVIVPVLETAFYRTQGHGKKRFRHLYFGYDLRDEGSANPVIGPACITDLTHGSTVTLSNLSETTAYSRVRRSLGRASHGIGLSLTHGANASGAARIYSIEADVLTRESGRR